MSTTQLLYSTQDLERDTVDLISHAYKKCIGTQGKAVKSTE